MKQWIMSQKFDMGMYNWDCGNQNYVNYESKAIALFEHQSSQFAKSVKLEYNKHAVGMTVLDHNDQQAIICYMVTWQHYNS